MASSDKESSCKEYNALKYKTMIMTGNNLENKIDNEKNVEIIDQFLMNEMKQNKKQSWNKLSKTEKLNKLNQYLSNNLCKTYSLSENEKMNTKKYIISLLDRKKLTKNSEIDYDETTGNINNIGSLEFNSTSRKFTLNKELNNSKKKVTKTKTVKKVNKTDQNK